MIVYASNTLALYSAFHLTCRCHRYVDHQLKTSRRFDAAGMEKDHPQLFVPIPRRRSSSSSSLASMSSSQGDAEMPEGQLRYWTADMCSRSPHLFDFVVTVRAIPSLFELPFSEREY